MAFQAEGEGEMISNAKGKKLLTELIKQEVNMDTIQKHYLENAGWDYTCGTPGSIWMWKKTWNKKIILVNQVEAIRIQKYWDGL
jgi:hypothetical protein